jgi:hypothetical protein
VNAGVLVCVGGLEDQQASIVTAEGTVSDGPHSEAIGGLAIVEVPSREEALEWAAKLSSPAAARKKSGSFGPDFELNAMLREVGSPR